MWKATHCFGAPMVAVRPFASNAKGTPRMVWEVSEAMLFPLGFGEFWRARQASRCMIKKRIVIFNTGLANQRAIVRRFNVVLTNDVIAKHCILLLGQNMSSIGLNALRRRVPQLEHGNKWTYGKNVDRPFCIQPCPGKPWVQVLTLPFPSTKRSMGTLTFKK